jgi:hypothetical protein
VVELRPALPTLDEIVLEKGTPCGPVIALRNKDEKPKPYGPARGEFNNWQAAVTEWSGRSRAVVVCLGDTDGLNWELEHLARRFFHERCLFLVPSRYSPAE